MLLNRKVMTTTLEMVKAKMAMVMSKTNQRLTNPQARTSQRTIQSQSLLI